MVSTSWLIVCLTFCFVLVPAAASPFPLDGEDSLQKRVHTSCAGNQIRQNLVAAALSRAQRRAFNAATAAASGSSEMPVQTVLQNHRSISRALVATRFAAIALIADNLITSVVYYCDPAHMPPIQGVDPEYCAKNPLTYAASIKAKQLMWNWTATLHELAHITGAVPAGNEFEIYKFEDIISPKVTMFQALRNADTYAVYAKHVWNNCKL
ncbi:hypothetical protein K440DRAFT_637477 [Wilcoxina mikolae CBS 423.85]|nr:hypothetical protein K440DRAFT_637477 [Wilcoxina mikolae CBS 423.85]